MFDPNCFGLNHWNWYWRRGGLAWRLVGLALFVFLQPHAALGDQTARIRGSTTSLVCSRTLDRGRVSCVFLISDQSTGRLALVNALTPWTRSAGQRSTSSSGACQTISTPATHPDCNTAACYALETAFNRCRVCRKMATARASVCYPSGHSSEDCYWFSSAATSAFFWSMAAAAGPAGLTCVFLLTRPLVESHRHHEQHGF